MALTAYLTLKLGGSTVQGSSRFKEREGQILVIGCSHEVVADRDPNGHPTGKPKHRALVIQKDIDRSSPILWQAFRDNVAFDFGFLEFTRFPPGGGQQEIHAAINFSKARIVAIQSFMPNARIGDNSPIPEYEEVSFVYDDINWKWMGKDVDDSDVDWTETGCDFSKDEATWVEALEARVQKAIVDGGVAAGNAAVAALKDAFQAALTEAPPK